MEEGSGWFSRLEDFSEGEVHQTTAPADWSTTRNSSPPTTRPTSVSAAAPFRLPPLAQAFGSSPPASPRPAAEVSLRHSALSRSQRALSFLTSDDNDPASPRRLKRRRLRDDREEDHEPTSVDPIASATGYRPELTQYGISLEFSTATALGVVLTRLMPIESHPREARLGAPSALPHQRGVASFSSHLQTGAIEHHHPEHSATRPTCCPPACSCRECVAIRSVLATIVLEAKVLDAHLASTLIGGVVPENPVGLSLPLLVSTQQNDFQFAFPISILAIGISDAYASIIVVSQRWSDAPDEDVGVVTGSFTT